MMLAASPFDETFRAGLIALQKGDVEMARTRLEAARDLEPKSGRVWVALSQVYWRLHRNGDAEEAAGKAAALAPEDRVVLRSLGIYYSETGQLARAADMYFQSAQPLLKQQKFGEAEALLEEGVARVPASEQLELALGVTEYGLRRFDKAADAFLRTIELTPETEQPYTFLGKILDQIPNKLPQVTERFAAYEAAHPDSAEAYLLHAKALDAQAGDATQALRLLDKSIALNGGDAVAHFERGTVLDRLQRFAEAATEFERAAALAPMDAAAHYRLARDYDRIGKHDAARAERDKHAQLVKARDTMP